MVKPWPNAAYTGGQLEVNGAPKDSPRCCFKTARQCRIGTPCYLLHIRCRVNSLLCGIAKQPCVPACREVAATVHMHGEVLQLCAMHANVHGSGRQGKVVVGKGLLPPLMHTLAYMHKVCAVIASHQQLSNFTVKAALYIRAHQTERGLPGARRKLKAAHTLWRVDKGVGLKRAKVSAKGALTVLTTELCSVRA